MDGGGIQKYAILEDDKLDHYRGLYMFLSMEPLLIGYNNLDFDGQIVEYIYRSLQQGIYPTGREIFEQAQKVIDTKDKFKLPYKEWTYSLPQLDLMTMNNFGIFGKPTSLKWLEFTTRQRGIQDLPLHFTTEVNEEQVKDILKYNTKDVQATFVFYNLCQGMIAMRKAISEKFNDPLIMNRPNSSIGEKIVLYSYCEHTNQEPKHVRKTFTKRKEIVIADVILDYISFESDLFKQVKEDFENLVLKADSKGVIKLKGAYEKEIDFQKMKVKYALGGIDIPNSYFF